MTKTLLDDAFAHHMWATLQVMDVCADLGPDQLEATAPGTYGTILDTLRHIVAADSGYLFAMTGGKVQPILVGRLGRVDGGRPDLPQGVTPKSVSVISECRVLGV